jgi:hypothetical protein
VAKDVEGVTAALTISILKITSGSLGSEFKCGMYGCENLGEVGIFVSARTIKRHHHQAQSLRPAVCKKFSHVDVKI